MAASKGFRILPFNHVHVLSETVIAYLRTCQKLAGGVGGGNFKFGFGNLVTHPCNGGEIC